ncbi:MAG: carbohydrate-binding family 9-like protein [Lentisphaeria bacterium]|nr:carbohydrate-binding family 9-like protein [Lentisphaeria bacterium]
MVMHKINLGIMALLVGGWVTGVNASDLVTADNSGYEVVKTRENIIIDGKLDELSWQHAKTIQLVTMDRGEESFYRSEMKLLYSEDYLYIGFDFAESDLKGFFGFPPARAAGELNTMAGDGWDYPEIFVMRDASYCEFFLDPDRDGNDYVELHLNTLNSRFDAWYKTTLNDTNGSRFSAVDWQCRGLKSAVQLKGTINNGDDIDAGWSGELAIPFAAMRQFSRKVLPPQDGDSWNVLLVRVMDGVDGHNFWSYPQVGYIDCHSTGRYGRIIFRDPGRKIGNLWSFSERTDADFFHQLRQLNVKYLISKNIPSPETVKLAGQYQIELIPQLSLRSDAFPGQPVVEQVQNSAELELLELLNGKKLYTVQEASAVNNTPKNYSPTPEQLRLLTESKGGIARNLQGYRFGEMPERMLWSGRYKSEVLLESNLLCLESEENWKIFKDKLNAVLARPDIKQLVVSDLGFRNYQRCYCPKCESLEQQYREKIRSLPQFKRGSVPRVSTVSMNNFAGKITSYVKAKRPDMQVINFANVPFVPNINFPARLDFDRTIQITGGFMRPDLMQIDKNAKVAARYNNIAMVTYAAPGDNMDFPVKSERRWELEMLVNLANNLQDFALVNVESVLNNSKMVDTIKRLQK